MLSLIEPQRREVTRSSPRKIIEDRKDAAESAGSKRQHGAGRFEPEDATRIIVT